MTTLYPFQSEGVAAADNLWQQGYRDICLVYPTGSGKTVMSSHIVAEADCPAIGIAHRQEIVSQISLAWAREGLPHSILAAPEVVRACTAQHIQELGKNYVVSRSKQIVAGVDTLVRRQESWFKDIGLVFQDECHHLLTRNKWGKARKMFPNARLLGVTATPTRADGYGLGAHADGYIQAMHVGPSPRDLINAGRLSEYRLVAPECDIDFESVPLAADGDYSKPKLSTAFHKSTRIVGDIVGAYLKFAAGKRGLTFVPDLKAAAEIAAAYRDAGVPAEVVSAKTPDILRNRLKRQLVNGQVLQLVNVDLFGEGYDCPAIEVVSMARRTMSFALYCQEFGRGLRVSPGKDKAIIIDHVGNWKIHGLPDVPRIWTLDRRERRTQVKPEIPIKICPECMTAYLKYLLQCPFCGHKPVPVGRSAPQLVDGDLFELSPEALMTLRGEIDKPPLYPYAATPVIINSINARYRAKQEARAALRDRIAQWAGTHSQAQDEAAVRELQRRFYCTFDIDVATAQTLNRADTEALIQRIPV